ncbi:hypothetical protein PS15m_012188 [Mucor circinelloides]
MAGLYPTSTFVPKLVRHFQQYHGLRSKRSEFHYGTFSQYLFRIDTLWRRVNHQAIQRKKLLIYYQDHVSGNQKD